MRISIVYAFWGILLFCIVVVVNYAKIPTKQEHVDRNRYNRKPVGTLRFQENNRFVDDLGVVWLRRNFLQSVFHNPLKNYVFETYDLNKTQSSEVEADKQKFDNGEQIFQTASFNFYSSFRFPVSHFFADMLPSFLYLFPNYNHF